MLNLHVRNLHIYKLKSNLNCSNIVKYFSVAMCNYLTKTRHLWNHMKQNQKKNQEQTFNTTMKQYFIVDKSILFMVPREDFTSPFSFLCSRAPQIFSALKSSVNLIHQHQHSPHTQPHIFQMWVPCTQRSIRHIWKCFSEVLGLQLVSHQELQVDPNDKNTCHVLWCLSR